jgi:hypothetical protein
MNVLTVHSDVASAIPATPIHRISIRFNGTSKTRFSTPQYKTRSVRRAATSNL